MSLKSVYEALEDISNTSSRNSKEKKIKQYINELPNFEQVVKYAYSPDKLFHTNRVDFVDGAPVDSVDNIFEILDYLSNKSGATNEDINLLSTKSSFDKETVEVVIRIVSKDLRCGVNVKTWAKYIKDIPNYQVMCCERDLERFIQKECKGNLKNIYKSQKLDGVRCSCNIDLIENRIISHLSRNGKEYPNFDVFDEELFKIAQVLKEDYRVRGKRYIQVDGEATAVGKNKEEVKSFQKLMTQIRRLNSIDKNLFRFHIFDVVLEKIIFKDRYEILEKINTNELTKDNKIVTLLIHDDLPEFIRNADDIREYTKYLTDQYGWEGLVLKNKYSYYELKRSHQWCKVKWMISRDVEVIGWEKGEPRGKYNSVLGKLICVYPDNGKKFGVGSGFSDEQRIEFMTDTPKLIEIEFQELTEEEVPRFPSFTRVREDKDEPN